MFRQIRRFASKSADLSKKQKQLRQRELRQRKLKSGINADKAGEIERKG